MSAPPPLWGGAASALRLMAGFARPAPVPGERRTVLPTALGDRPALYIPAVGQPRGMVLAIHGMSPLGEEDPRWVRALRAIARAGHDVLSPRFSCVAGLRVDAAQPARFAAAIASLAADPHRCPEGRLRLFSVSFSGGLSLAAAARPEAHGAVISALAVGPYAALQGALAAVLRPGLPDPFARMVVLSNFLHLVERLHPAEEAALRGAAQALHRNDTHAAAALLSGLSPRAAAWARGEGEPEAFVAALSARAPGLLEALDPVRHAAAVPGVTALLHGAADPVIPAQQSLDLAAALRAAGRPVHVHLTGLLSHGDADLRLRAVRDEGAGLLRTFSAWLA